MRWWIDGPPIDPINWEDPLGTVEYEICHRTSLASFPPSLPLVHSSIWS